MYVLKQKLKKIEAGLDKKRSVKSSNDVCIS